MSENLAASVAAKPKEESLYESLLRYHEEGKRGKIESIATKSASYDEEKYSKFPAKPSRSLSKVCFLQSTTQ
jgi:hypothetical protein